MDAVTVDWADPALVEIQLHQERVKREIATAEDWLTLAETPPTTLAGLKEWVSYMASEAVTLDAYPQATRVFLGTLALAISRLC